MGGSVSGEWIVGIDVRFEHAFLKVLVVGLLGISVGDVEVKSQGSRKHEVEGVPE